MIVLIVPNVLMLKGNYMKLNKAEKFIISYLKSNPESDYAEIHNAIIEKCGNPVKLPPEYVKAEMRHCRELIKTYYISDD